MDWEIVPPFASPAVGIAQFQEDAARFRAQDEELHTRPSELREFSIEDAYNASTNALPLQSIQRAMTMRKPANREDNIIVSSNQSAAEIQRALMTLVPGGEDRLQFLESAAQQRKQAVSRGDVIVTVEFYNPTRISKTQEFRILGSQSLSLLRDYVYCLRDFQDCNSESTASFFFIDHVFYIHDPSRQPDDDGRLEAWARSLRGWSEGTMVVKSMQETKMLDLTLRIGAPQVYCHRGDCEHIMVVSDVRMVEETDPQTTDRYPFLTFQSKIRRKKCRVCDIYPARWVSWGDRVAPDQPAYYCEKCYASNDKFTASSVSKRYYHDN